MSDVLVIEVNADEKEAIETLAHRRGYDSSVDYVRALIRADAEHEDDEAILEGLRQGLREAMRGEGLTEDEFWKALRQDD